jgi:hypothetical protein
MGLVALLSILFAVIRPIFIPSPLRAARERLRSRGMADRGQYRVESVTKLWGGRWQVRFQEPAAERTLCITVTDDEIQQLPFPW